MKICKKCLDSSCDGGWTFWSNLFALNILKKLDLNSVSAKRLLYQQGAEIKLKFACPPGRLDT